MSMKDSYRGALSVLGAFLVQLTVGSVHGTFGNLLPYISSYMRQNEPTLTHGDVAQSFSAGGIAQGITFFLGGLVIVPLLGLRGCLVVSSILFTLSPLLTYFTLDLGVTSLAASYCILGMGAVNIAMIPTFLMSCSWFPNNRGLVIGILMSGFGLSSSIFVPFQLFLINPTNIAPAISATNGSSSPYFEDRIILDRLPGAFLYLGATYAALFTIGVFLCKEKVEERKTKEATNMKKILRDSISFLCKEMLFDKDFYLLFVTRTLLMIVCGAFLAHWKSFSFTQNQDDALLSLVGGIVGIPNCLSRLIGGYLLDRIRFNILMPGIFFTLTVVCLSTFFISQVSFIGMIICIFLIYLLSFCHFSVIPAQCINLFSGPHVSVVQGSVGLADTFGYFCVGIINSLVMSRDEDPKMFLWFFLVLATCSFLTVVVTAMVTNEKLVKTNNETKNAEIKSGNDNFGSDVLCESDVL